MENVDRFLASLKTVFVDKPENVLTLLKILGQVSTLQRIILTKKLSDENENEIRKKAKDVGIEIMTYNQLRVRSTIPGVLFSIEFFRVGTWPIESSRASCKAVRRRERMIIE